ncbi:MAG: type II toxin-antitoxin system RelE/ParE family toxin [Planctomycetaceae bacterium]
MPEILQTRAAEESRLNIWLHVARDNIAAADRLLDAIDDKCRLYAAQPEMGDIRPDLGEMVRCFPVGNYVVLYRPIQDGILVLLVIHGARDIPAVLRHLRGLTDV